MLTQRGKVTTTSDVDANGTDEDHGSVVRGILGGGALGAGLGVVALAIPGVGLLVAAGAIAVSAVPGAMAIGAAAGAAAGTLNETLVKHGIDEQDATHCGDTLGRGGVLVSVDTSAGAVSAETASDIFYRNGGHNSRRSRATAYEAFDRLATGKCDHLPALLRKLVLYLPSGHHVEQLNGCPIFGSSD